MREIVLDTETTGLDPGMDHRIVEVACLELRHHVPTEAEFHCYLNPERDMPEDAFRIHGLSADFLAGHPRFAEVADDFLEFIGDDPLVIHNAEFDLRFLNAELARIGRPLIPSSRAVDTVQLARRKNPGAQASLDALCRRFDIDLSERDLHGARIDVQLLAKVYLQLVGGSQPTLELGAGAAGADSLAGAAAAPPETARPPRPHAPDAAETARHAELVARLKQPIWDL